MRANPLLRTPSFLVENRCQSSREDLPCRTVLGGDWWISPRIDQPSKPVRDKRETTMSICLQCICGTNEPATKYGCARRARWDLSALLKVAWCSLQTHRHPNLSLLLLPLRH